MTTLAFSIARAAHKPLALVLCVTAIAVGSALIDLSLMTATASLLPV